MAKERAERAASSSDDEVVEPAITNVTATASGDGKSIEVTWDGGISTVERTDANGGVAYKGDGSRAIWVNQESPFTDTTFPAERGAKVEVRYKVGEDAISDVVTIGGEDASKRDMASRAPAGADSLDDMSNEDLHKRASDLNIDGRSNLTTKHDLIRAIRRAERK